MRPRVWTAIALATVVAVPAMAQGVTVSGTVKGGKGMKISAIGLDGTATTGTIKAKAAFANEEGALFPNQFVNVKLQVNLLKDVLTVPSTAVQNNYVYLVRPDGTVTQRRIRVGVVDGDRVSVEGELQDGDQVVTDGIDRLREGTKVGVIEAAAVAR